MMPHPNVITDFLALAAIVVTVALAMAHVARRQANAERVADSTICEVATRDAAEQYRINIMYGYSARQSRATVRAMLHNKYALKGFIARAVMHNALYIARTNEQYQVLKRSNEQYINEVNARHAAVVAARTVN